MPDTPDLGTASPVSDANGTPSQPVQPEGQKPIDGDVAKMLADVVGKLDTFGRELRGLQGRQQKADNKFSDFQNQLARLNEYKAQGLSDTEALAEMQADDANDQWRQSLEQKIDNLAAMFGSGGTQTNPQQNMVTAALSEYGLDPKDPFVAGKLAGQNPANKTDAELLAARIFRDKVNAPPTNAAQQSAQSGQAQQTGNANDEKFRRLVELQQEPSKNFKEISQLTRELEAAKYF